MSIRRVGSSSPGSAASAPQRLRSTGSSAAKRRGKLSPAKRRRALFGNVEKLEDRSMMAISITTAGVPYFQNFDGLASSGTSSTMPAEWVFNESTGNTTYTAGTGSSNTGDTYSFGAAGNTERALGSVNTSSLFPIIGTSFTNNTGGPISSLTITYTGEQWRFGEANRGSADRLDFQYSTTATAVQTGIYEDYGTLNFIAPVITGAVTALDGNAAANRRTMSAIVPVTLPAGGTIWLRWNNFNATGADDGLAIDDFTLTANAPVAPTFNIPNQTTRSYTPITVPFTVADDLPNNVNFTVVSSSNEEAFPTSNFVFGGSGTNRTITITPATGTADPVVTSITVRASDGSFETDDTFDITLNGAPTLTLGAVSGKAGDLVKIPVLLTTNGTPSEPILGIDLAVLYDTNYLQFLPTPSLTVPGPGPASSNNPNIIAGGRSDDPGKVSAGFAFQTTPISGNATNFLLGHLNAIIKSTAPLGTTPINMVKTMVVGGSTTIITQINEGDVILGPDPTNATSDINDTLVTVTAGSNVAPVNNLPAPISGREDTNILLHDAGNNPFFTVTDGSTGQNYLTVTLSVPSASVGTWITSDVGSSAVPLLSNGGATIAISGLEDQINLVLGTLEFRPALDTFGTVSVNVSTTDTIANTNDTFDITVLSSNDRPSFTVLGNQTAVNNATQVSVPGFVTSSSVGPSNESAQAITAYNRISTSSTLFSVQPAIATNGTLTFTPAAGQTGVATVTFRARDNGGTANGGLQDSLDVTFTITLTPGAGNTAPTINAITPNPLNINEDAGLQTINLSGITAGGAEVQNLTVTASSNNAALLGTISVTYTPNNPTGSISFTPVANASGTGTITVTVTDAGPDNIAGNGDDASTPVTLVVNVAEVNDAPSFTTLGNQTVNEDAGPQTVNGFATANAGGGETQTFTYNITNNTNSGLFSAGPSISPTGVLTYTPVANAFGTATITVSVTDSGSPAETSPTQTFVITVNSVNDTPSFTTLGNQTVNEDAGPQTVNGFATASAGGGTDENGQTFTYNITNNTNSGLFSAGPSISPTGVLTYTPVANASGTATITVSVTDNGTPNATSPTQTFVITVNSVNDTPSFTTLGNQTVNEDAGPQTVNGFATASAGGGTDENGQTFTYNITNNTNSGLFSAGPSISPTGVLTYTPVANAFGTATITVSVTDNGTPNATSPTQTFVITVNSVNDTPSFTTLGNQTVNEDAGPQTVNGFATASAGGGTDENGQTFTYNITNNTNSGLFSAGPSISPTGVLTYTPVANAFGTATITVSVTDNGAPNATSPTQTFVITVNSVNDTPSFTTLGNQTVNEDAGPQTVNGFATASAGGGTDENGQTFTYNITNNTNSGLFSAGPSISPTGVLTYTPVANAFGTATITVSVTDNGAPNATSPTQTFTINLLSVNDAPSFVKGADQTVPFNSGAQSVTGWATALSTGAANESQSLSFTLSNNNTGLFSVQPVVLPNGTLQYTPMANVAGTAIVTIQIVDNGGTANSGVDTSAPQTFNITVQPAVANAPPTINPLTPNPLNINEDAGLQTINLSGITAGGAEVQNLTVTASSNNAALLGTISVNYTPNSSTGSISFTPVSNLSGTGTITVTVTDAGLDGIAGNSDDGSTPVTLVVNVAEVNDTPSFTTLGNQTVNEDAGPQTVNGFATANAGGGETQTFTYNITNNTNSGLFSAGPSISPTGVLTYTPVANAFGTATITVSVTDSGTPNATSPTQTFVITVNSVNDTPSFTTLGNQTVNEDAGPQTVNGFATASAGGGTDENGQTFTYNITNNTNSGLFSAGPSISPTGVLTYTPVANAFGTATITVSVTDNGAPNATSPTQTFVITVNSVNDTPSFTTLGNQTVNEDAGPQTVNGFATANAGGGTDENGQTFTYNITNNTNSGLFSAGPSISPTGVLTYTPVANAFGTATITVSVTDNGTPNATSPTQTFVITVNSVNDTPSFTTLGNQTVNEDAGPQTVNGFATASAGGGTDENGQTFTYNITNNTNSGLFSAGPSISPTGVLTYTPVANASGTATITVSVTDSGTPNATSPTQTFTITVTGVNDQPSFVAGANPTILEDAGAQSISNFATGFSPGPGNDAGQTVLEYVVSGVTPGFFSVAPSVSPAGTLTYTVAPNQHGSGSFQLAVRDNGGSPGVDTSAAVTVTITVTQVNDAPTFTLAGNQTAAFNGPMTVIGGFASAIAQGPLDPAQNLNFQVTNDANSLFSLQPTIAIDGTLTFTPANGQSGTAIVTVRLADDGGIDNGGVNISPAQTFTITIGAAPVNTPPTINALSPNPLNINEDASLQTINLSGITAGGAEVQNLTVTAGSNNAGLTGTINVSYTPNGSTGSISFTPVANAVGSATITVTVTDAGFDNIAGNGDDRSTPVTMIVNVAAVNDTPSFTTLGSHTVNEDAAAQSVSGFATANAGGDIDENGQTFTYNIANNSNPALFSAQPSISSTGVLTYTPAANAFGSATITVSVSDNGTPVATSPTQTFTINVNSVNDLPSFTTLGNQTVNEDAGPQTVNGFATADAGGGETGQTFTYNITNNTNSALFSAQPSISPTGVLTYTPVANAFGSATITVSVTDSGSPAATSPTQTFTITVNSVNDTPSFTTLGNQAVNEDAGPQTVNGFATASAGGGTDENGQTFTYNITNNTNSGLFSSQPSISPTGVLTYTPVANAFGTATITVSVSDSGSPSATSPTQTFTITVNSVNDTPSFTTLGNQTVAEDAGAQSVSGFATAIAGGGADENGQTFTYNITNNTNSALFSVAPSISPTGVLTYTPAANTSGSATITVAVSDNGTPAATSPTQTFTITVTAVNDAPSFVAGANPTILEDAGAQTINNFATGFSPGPGNDSGQTLLNYVVTGVTPGFFSVAPSVGTDGTLTYTVAPNAFGSGSFQLAARDNGGTPGVDISSAVTVTIAVTPVNDVPVFTAGGNQSVAYNAGPQTLNNFATGIGTGAANETQTLTFELSNTNNGLFSSQPTISAAGTLQYTPMPNTSGTATVTVRLRDNGGTSDGGVDLSPPQTFTLTVAPAPVNTPPTINPLSPNPLNLVEDAGLQTIGLSGISAGGADTQNLIVTASSNNPSLTGPITVSYSPNNPTGSISFTPVANANGTATITVTVTDAGLDNIAGNSDDGSTPVTMVVNVSAVNDTPSFTVGPNQTVNEDPGAVTVNPWATGVSRGGGTDEAGQVLTFNIVGNTNPGLFSALGISSTGVLSYTPTLNANGSATITISLSDDGGGANTTATQQFTITVNPTNDLPVFTLSANHTVNEDAGPQAVNNFATGIGPGGGPDEAGQTYNFNITNNTNLALFSSLPTLSPTGVLTYTPAANMVGSATITVTLSDSGGAPSISPPQTFTITVNGVNDPPSFVGGSNINVNEDAGPQTFNNWAALISAGPSDEAGQTLTFNVSANSNPSLFSSAPSVSPTGTLTFTPAANANGSAIISVQLSDNGGGTNTSAVHTFTISVSAVNDPPTFTAGPNQSVNEDAGPQSVAWASSISAGPTADEAGQTLTFNITGNSNLALFSSQPTISSSGVLSYTPAANASGLATITVTLSDNGGAPSISAPVTFTITVNPLNDAPSFLAGPNQTVNEDGGPQSVSWAANVSAGPPDEVGQTVTFNITNNSNAPLFSVAPSISPSGVLTYTPAANAFGVATITYTASDSAGATTSPQTFTITVNPVNDAPSFNVGPNQTIAFGSGAQSVTGFATSISSGPSNESVQTVQFNIVGNSNPALFTTPPAIAPNGTLTYTPSPTASGSALITVNISDNGGTDFGGVSTSGTQSFTITITAQPINNPPTINPISSLTINEDAGLQNVGLSGITAGISESQPLTVTVVSSDPLIIPAPSLSYTSPNSTGSLSFTPLPNAFGTVTITVTVRDTGLDNIPGNGDDGIINMPFTVTVNPVNDTPSFTPGASQTVNEDAGPQTVTGFATAISAGPTNESGQTLSFNIVGNNNAGLFSVAPAISPSGVLTYTPAANAFGSATISYTLSDNGGGAATTGIQTFTINVNPVNDAPSFAVGANQSVSEDAGPQTVGNWASALSAGPANENGQALSFNISNNSNPSLFSVLPSVSPTGTLTYTPAANVSGTATITLNIVDNGGTANGGVDASASQTFTITVGSTNDTPTFVAGSSQTVNEDAGPQTVSGWATAISAGPADEAGQTLTFNVTGNSNPLLFSVAPAISPTGVLTYTPAPNAFGSATITVTLSDNGGGLNTSAPQTFTINVNPVNDAPSFTVGPNQVVNEDAGGQSVSGFATALSAGPSNEAGQQLTVNITGNSNAALFSVQPTISPTGTLTYTPAANASGVATITVTVTDNGGTANGGVNTSAAQTFTITVNDVNDNPTFTAGSSQAVNEDAGLQTVNGWASGISAGPANESAQTLTFLVTGNSNPSLFSAGPSISPTGTLTYTPAANAFGTALISVQLNDSAGGASTVQSFTINIAPVNDAPNFTAGVNQTVPEDAGAQSVSGWATGISFGPANEAPQTVIFNVTGNTNSALFSVQPTVSPAGVLTYTPAPNASGSATITLVAVDNGGTSNGGVNTSAPQTFTINVTPVNDAPDAADSTFTTPLNTPLNVNVVVNDPDGPTLTYAVTMSPGLGTLTSFNTATGAFTYTPNTGATGLDLFTFSVTDGTNTDTATVRISIQSSTPVVTASGGNLQVLGTASEDTVIISRGPSGQVLVRTASGAFNASAYYPLTGAITVSGGDGRDYIVVNGLTNPTNIDAGAGDDYISSGTGDDVIIGGTGNDQINASGGNNVVWGDELGQQDLAVGGNDILSSLTGNDVLYGGGGDDQVYPGDGQDYVYAGQGNDTVSAGAGNDRVFGGAGNDILVGDGGDDVISGGSGSDYMIGGDGNDVLIGGAGGGGDSIDGGTGGDLIIAGDTTNSQSSLVGDANDTALMALLANWNTTHAAGIANGIVTGDDGANDILTGSAGDDDFYALLSDTINDLNTTGSGTDRRFP